MQSLRFSASRASPSTASTRWSSAWTRAATATDRRMRRLKPGRCQLGCRSSTATALEAQPDDPLVADRDARLAALGKAIEALPKNAPQLERATAKELHALLTSLAGGSTESHDYPVRGCWPRPSKSSPPRPRASVGYDPQHDGEHCSRSAQRNGGPRARFVPASISAEARRAELLALARPSTKTRGSTATAEARCELAERGWMCRAAFSLKPTRSGSSDHQRAREHVSARPPRVFAVRHSRGGGVARARACQALSDRAVLRSAPPRPASASSPTARSSSPPATTTPRRARARDARRCAKPDQSAPAPRVYANVEHWLAVQAALPGCSTGSFNARAVSPSRSPDLGLVRRHACYPYALCVVSARIASPTYGLCPQPFPSRRMRFESPPLHGLPCKQRGAPSRRLGTNFWARTSDRQQDRLTGADHHANRTFQRISGFGEDDLLGAAHGMVPPGRRAATAAVRRSVRARNLCHVVNHAQNGDHYWVSRT